MYILSAGCVALNIQSIISLVYDIHRLQSTLLRFPTHLLAASLFPCRDSSLYNAKHAMTERFSTRRGSQGRKQKIGKQNVMISHAADICLYSKTI